MTRDLGIIALESALHMGEKIDHILSQWRGGEHFLIPAECPRFGSGEGKGLVKECIRDKDLFILVDVCNHSLTYSMNGRINHMSPDDHYQDLKRVISACAGRANRISVIMPFLYESRQHRRGARESLDCAIMLQELSNMGVYDIITFDAHDPRVQNAIPSKSFEDVSPALQFTLRFLAEYDDLTIDSEHMMFIAPDEGAMGRAVFMASVFGINVGMFYKRRDYTRIIDGCNPIVAHDFCGESVSGKDVIVIDDMIASGESSLDVARQLKDRGARRVFLFSTFGLFTRGFEKFDRACEEGIIEKVFTTDLIYMDPEIFQRKWYCSVGMNNYLAAIIDTLNKGQSMNELIRPAHRIQETIQKYLKGVEKQNH